MTIRESTVLTGLDYTSVAVNRRTEWTFVEVRDEQGITAVVETTCGRDVTGALSRLMAAVERRPIEDESNLAGMAGVEPEQARQSMALATAVSALRSALVDIRAQRDGVSLTEAMGGRRVGAVQLYANVNRRLLGFDRRPRAFAATAERAARDGFGTVKCAPFDEVVRGAGAGADLTDLSRPGLERVAAVRKAVGNDVGLLVDCHGRFDLRSAPSVADELAKLGVAWFEEPVEPTDDPSTLAEIASRVGIPIAGGESGYGADFFEGLVEMGAVEVAMPDVKWCGGVAEAVRAAAGVARLGGRTSLHGPSGPVGVLSGAHVTAAMPSAMPLEFGVYEVPWRAELVEPAERVEGGRLWLPAGPGLGARLNPKVVERYGHRWNGR